MQDIVNFYLTTMSSGPGFGISASATRRGFPAPSSHAALLYAILRLGRLNDGYLLGNTG
jgi:hypothetical protein